MRAAILLLACLSSTSWSWAGNFQQAYEAALRSDAIYQAARAEFASVEQNVPMARAGLLPNISVSLSDSKVNGSRTFDNNLGPPVTSSLDYRAPVQSLNIRVPIFNREASQKYKWAQTQVIYAEAVFATRKADLVDRLASAYLQRLLSEQAVQVARAQLEATQAQSALARRRLQLGEGTRLDLVEAQASEDMAQVLLIDSQNQLSLAILSLRQITGLYGKFPTTVTDGFTSQPAINDSLTATNSLSELLSKAQASNPGIAVRQHALALAQLAVTRNRAGHYPRLDFIANATSFRNESLSTLNQSAHQQSLGLQINLPLYSGGYVSASVTQALADQDKAEAELAAEQQAVAKNLTKLYLSVKNGGAKVQAYRSAMESATLALEGTHKGLQTGFNTLADVVIGQRKLAQSKHELTQAIYEYLLARTRLSVLTGAEPAQTVAHIDDLLRSPQISPP